jgi:MarR family transcriptional regulator, transcriptional regulator for hemolysin
MQTLQVRTNAREDVGHREDHGLTDRIACAGFSLIDAGRLYTRRFEERSRDLALDLTQCRALIVLAQNQGITQQRLAELTALGPAALGRILDGLERRRLVNRRPRTGDRRARSLAVTQEAAALVPIIWGLITESHVEALKGLSTGERRVLMKALDRVLVNLRLRGEVAG